MYTIKVKESASIESFMRTTKGVVEINDHVVIYKFIETPDYAEVYVQENGNWIELVEDDLEEDSTYKILYELIVKVGPKDFGLVDEIWEFNTADY